MARLYKYTSFESGFEHNLQERTLQFAPPASQNDPNEAFPSVDGPLRREMARVALDIYPKRTLFDRRFEYLTEVEWVQYYYRNRDFGATTMGLSIDAARRAAHAKYRQFGILSLTKANTNALLWSHYADGAKGLCLGFSEFSQVFQESAFTRFGLAGLYDVVYSPSRARFVGATVSERVRGVVLTKNEIWSYEQEVRCFREIPDEQEQVRPLFHPEDLREVVLGRNITLEHAHHCVEYCTINFPWAELKIAYDHPERFEMILLDCPRGRFLDLLLTPSATDVSPLLHGYEF